MRLARSSAFALAGLVAVAPLSAGGAPTSVSDPIPDPGRSIVSNDDASSIATNPGNLAFIREPELRWNWFFTQPTSGLATRGHSFDFVYPLWIFASGLRLDLIDPPPSAPEPFLRDNYQWIRWSLGGRVGHVLGVGSTLGWSISPNDSLRGQFSFTAGATFRPSAYIGLAAVARDINIPTSADGTTKSERSYDFGAAIRPVFGKRAFEIGLDASFRETSKKWEPRATLGVDIPYVGRLRGDAKIDDLETGHPNLLATAGLDLNMGPAQIDGGLIFGNEIGWDTPGFYLGAAFRFFREPGIPLPSHVVRIDIDSTPGVRGHFALLRRLWRLADDPECDGVLLVMHDEPAATLAHADELGDAFRTLRAHHKKVICHLEDAGGRALYTCAQADRIAMNPAGGLRFSGLSSRYFYLGGTLDKLHVKADFVRIGAHKTAAEQLTNETASDIAKSDHQDLVDQAEDVFLHDVGGGRNISKSKLRETITKGPFLAKEARDAGLVDTLAYPDEVGAVVDEVMGKTALVGPESPFPRAPDAWRAENKIAVIYLDGDMVDGESQTIPFIGIRLAGSRTIAGAFQAARGDASVKAVVFRVETGGGSSLAADVILREVQLTAKQKPVIVSMGSAAASGGYYVSVGGDRIFANRTTITGSIGIFYGKVDVSGLLAMLGVHSDAFRSSPRADAESLYRPFTDDEREELGHKVKQFYDLFVGRVAEGRKMKPEDVDKIGRGRVWTGAQAKENGLVDSIGGFREALAEARKQAHLRDDTAIVELPEEDDSLLGILLNLLGIKLEAGATPAVLIPPGMLEVARALAPFVVYGADEPLARADWFEETSLSKRPFGMPDDPAGSASSPSSPEVPEPRE